jgi:hypothetical protein
MAVAGNAVGVGVLAGKLGMDVGPEIVLGSSKTGVLSTTETTVGVERICPLTLALTCPQAVKKTIKSKL